MTNHGLVLVLLLFAATGVSSFTVNTKNANEKVKEFEGVDLTCSYSANFGSNARVEWKFSNVKGSQTYVVYNGKVTQPYADRVQLYGGSNLRFSKVNRKDNGFYDCEVTSSTNTEFKETRVTLTVLVPPSKPMCRIPVSSTTGKPVTLTCFDGEGSPPPTYRWYKNGTPLPENPSQIAAFKNLTYTLDPKAGKLTFPSAKKTDTAQYSCEAFNEAGPPQTCKAVKMEVRDLNVGGIVAGVIVALLLLALLAFGIWFAHKKGYFPRELSSLVSASSAHIIFKIDKVMRNVIKFSFRKRL
uniref:Junctional adhesion molecule A n=1 Tax=Gouania willdenowi TaxID=441366 RepID=A0A8C5G8C9_GOUWI